MLKRTVIAAGLTLFAAYVEQQAAAGVSPILGTGPQNEPPVAR